MSNVRRVLDGDFFVKLTMAEFEEVNRSMVRSIVASTTDWSKKYTIGRFLQFGNTVDPSDHPRCWYHLRAWYAVTRVVPDGQSTSLECKEWRAWLDKFKHYIVESHTIPISYYGVPYREIPFDWQNA